MGSSQLQLPRLMTTLVLDAGALVALARGDTYLAALRAAGRSSSAVKIPVGALAQAWRGGPRQALLARALKGCDEVPLDGATARQLGELCGNTRTKDVIDASVAVTAARAARRGAVDVLTSDRGDIESLLAALNAPANVVDV